MAGPSTRRRPLRTARAWLLIGALAALPSGLVAHHSFAAQYDKSKPITLTGTVTKMEWMNPHIYFYLDVREAQGTITSWAIEGGAPHTLYRAGWRRDSLKVGEVVTIEGFLARDGSKLANMATAQLADGRKIFGLSSQ